MSTTHPQESILRTLNKAQCRAVTSRAKTVAILAGPGSGKTHTLTSRVVWLINHEDYEPQDVIVATFTVKAAREMKERIGKALGDGREKKIVLGTFHGVARRYLAAYGSKIGIAKNFGIADDGDSRAIIKRIMSRLKLGLDPAAARAWISKRKARGSADALASQQKPKPENPELLACYNEYQDVLKRSNLLDYDDLLTRCVELLRAFPVCVSNVQAVLIDEYQDTNGIQYELMKLFAQARRRITIVGDPDQSIYGWRSAEIKNLHRLLREFPGTDEISLEENYRSSQRILDVSLKVIQQDAERYDKILVPTHNSGTRPVLRGLKSSAHEADWLVGEIRRVMMLSGGMATYDDVAILLRSASLSRHIETALGKAGIRYRMVGGFKFYERAEIKLLLDYLRVVYHPDNNDALVRVINVPRRGFGEATVKGLLTEAETTGRSLWKLLIRHCRGDGSAKTNITKAAELNFNGGLRKMIERLRAKVEGGGDDAPCDLESLVDQLIKQLNFQKYLVDTYEDEHEQRWANVQEFISLAKDFKRELEDGDEDSLPEIKDLDQARGTDALGRFLANVSLASDAQTSDDAEEHKATVTISTIHAAKGLEWPVVFVSSVYEGMIPHGRSEDLAEERRLLYVAMTRAKALLYLSCPIFNAKGERVSLSQFLPSNIQRQFAKRGPAFERTVLEEMARILGREAPTQGAVYGNMPPMFSTEDDLHPVDPESESNGGADGHRPKRQRVASNGGGAQGGAAPGEPQPWNRSYATTMERASSFTMPPTMGFVTASAHQAAITESVAHKPEPEPEPKRTKTAKGKPQPANQMSLASFLTGGPKLTAPPSRSQSLTGSTHPSFSSRELAPASTRPAIDPELAAHRLGGGRTLPTKPAATLREPLVAAKHYNCFSSSPPKVEADVDSNQTRPLVAREPPKQPASRSATSLHTTTIDALSRPGGGVKRALGVKMTSGSSVTKTLNKPFKTPTMTRRS